MAGLGRVGHDSGGGPVQAVASTAPAHAGGAAQGAQAIAGIFEAAKSAITHPAAVLANRLQLVQLVRSNLSCFAAPAIAATEGAYEEMWAQNVASLTGYHSAASWWPPR